MATKTIIAFFWAYNAMWHAWQLIRAPHSVCRRQRFYMAQQGGVQWTPRPTNPPQTTRLFAAVLLLLRLIATCELFHVFIATAIQSRYLYNLFQQLVLLAAAELRDLVAVRLQIIIMWLVAHTHTCSAIKYSYNIIISADNVK